MNVLGFDTCFGALSVAVGLGLGEPGARVLERCEPMATGHAERLLPLIADLLDEAGISLERVDRIAVTCGPGSFTGTRISVAAARAFRLALQIPVVTFTSLEAITLHPGIGDVASDEDLAIAVDAHRSEAYVQVFDGATRAALCPPQIVPVADFASIGRGRRLVVAGTAAEAVVAAVAATGGSARARDGILFPAMGAAVARAAGRVPAEGPVQPLYLRPPDAKPQEGKSLARALA